MKILHCCLSVFYIDGYSYQENILPREHKRMGHEVKIITSTETFKHGGGLTYLKPSKYLNEDNIEVIRLPYLRILPHYIMTKLRIYKGLKKELKDYSPDIIFLHSTSFMGIKVITNYKKKNKHVRIIVDNHTDFINSARNFFSKNLLHRLIYKHCTKIIEPYAEVFWGVTLSRCDFLANMYGVKRDKIKLLVMGVEDDKVEFAKNNANQLRSTNEIKKADFVIVTGGKIGLQKKQTLMLMNAVRKLGISDIKLIIFGSIAKELKDEFFSLVDGKYIKYVGWISPDESYLYFSLADLVVFPSTHSVFWEQVVGQGKPMLCKYWEGMTHVDIGGNCRFLYEDTEDELKSHISDLYHNREKLDSMKKVAEEKGMSVFSYREIAKRSIFYDSSF